MHFYTESQDSIVVYNWNFGDGSSSADAKPIHTFLPGDYRIKLNFTLANGCVGETEFDGYVSIRAPFKEDFTVDVEALRRVVNFSIDGGIEYLVVLGTTAENATLSAEEKELVIATVVEVNAGRLPLVLGVGGNNTLKIVPYRVASFLLSVLQY